MAEEQKASGEQPKKFVLRRRERVPAETTQGRFFVRHVVVRDLATFSKYVDKGDTVTSFDHEELGKLALLTLVCSVDADESTPALTEETLAVLTPSDISTLANAVAKACRLESASTIDSLNALGSALLKSLSQTAKQLADSSAAIRQTVESSFGALSTSLKASLGDRLSELSAARAALGTSSAVGAAIKAQEKHNALFRTALGAVMPRVVSTDREFGLTPLPNLDALRPPKFEDTAAGKTAARAASASEESARQMTEVAGLMGTMADRMAALQTVFLSKVLPEWFRDLEEGAEATRTTLRQAESSLFWAKWALIASVVVSILMTGWQVWLAREYKLENDKQQEKSELLMQQQLTALQELNMQLIKKPTRESGLQAQSTSSVRTSTTKAEAASAQRPMGDSQRSQ